MRRVAVLTLVFGFVPFGAYAQRTDIGASFATTHLSATSASDARLTFRRGSGGAIDLNHFWMKNVSTDVAYLSTSGEGSAAFAEGGGINLGSLDLRMITLLAQWHFAPDGFFDPYVGAGAARVTARDLRSADLSVSGVSGVHIEKKWSACANAGVHFNLMPRFGFVGDAKYLRYKPRSAAPGDLEAIQLKLNPLVVSIGVRLRL